MERNEFEGAVRQHKDRVHSHAAWMLHGFDDARDVAQEALLKLGFTVEQLETATIKKAVGCENCHEGYKGRLGIYEVVRITPTIARIIMEEGNSIQIHEQARAEGFNDLRKSALQKVAQGLTSLEEANRITVD
jgi:type IV pilus assembly protein PilB